MAGGEFRVFVSAVTNEFGRARDMLAADLRGHDRLVRVQSDFTQGGDSNRLLDRLHDYIRDCSEVICIVGKRSGGYPPPAAAARFAKMLPADISAASYTQWELFFASYYNRRLYKFLAKDDYVPDVPDDQLAKGSDFPDLQAAFVKHVTNDGLYLPRFSTVHELGHLVLKEKWLPHIVATTPKPASKPIVLPYPSIGSLFKGRDEFVRRLGESLNRKDGGRTAITNINAVYGLGGIGKTRLSVEYGWAHQDDYCALLFIIADTPETLRTNLAALAATLIPTLDATDDKKRLEAVLDWLKTNPGWFLILDNVDSKAAMDEVERLLPQIMSGHVVITSRLADFAVHVEPLELDVLDLDDATEFLLDRTRGRRRLAADDKAQARAIAGDLGGLALALEQAAAYIAKDRLTFEGYRKLWNESRDKVASWSDPAVTKYPRAVAVTWQTSVDQLTDTGRRLLQRLAWLAPEPIPDFLLDVPVPSAKSENLHNALADLAAYSLVTRDAEGPFFLVHRLVQDVTRRSVAGDGALSSLNEALGWVDAAFSDPPDDVRNWPRLEPLAPHARAVAEYGDAAGIAEPTARLMNQIGLLLKTKALHAEAEPLYRKAIAIGESGSGPDHPVVAIRLGNLAALLQATARLTEAEPLIRRSLGILERSNGPYHPDVATALNNLAQLLQVTNRLTEAEPFVRRVVEIFEKIERETEHIHPNFAGSLSNLAALLSVTDRLAEAEPLTRRALAIEEKNYGLEHPYVAINLNNLAQLLKATNRLDEAEPLMRRALAIDEQSYGPHHPEVAIDLNNFAELLTATNRLDEAEPLLRRALAIDEASYGSNHPNVARDLHNLARLLEDTDRLAEAELAMGRALAIFIEFGRKAGHQHPFLARATNNYRSLLKASGKSPTEIQSTLDSLLNPPG